MSNPAGPYVMDKDYPIACHTRDDDIKEISTLLTKHCGIHGIENRAASAALVYRRIRELKLGDPVNVDGGHRFRSATAKKAACIYRTEDRKMLCEAGLDREIDGLYGPRLGPFVRGTGAKL